MVLKVLYVKYSPKNCVEIEKKSFAIQKMKGCSTQKLNQKACILFGFSARLQNARR